MSFGPVMRLTVGDLRIELAPLTKESVEQFVGQDADGGLQQRSITRFLGMDSAPTVEHEHEWYEKVRNDPKSLVWGIWVIEDREGLTVRTLIGNSALTGIGEGGHTKLFRQASSGSMIFRKEYWGRGIASATHKARTWYAFTHLGLHRINSAVIQENRGSRKALERSGYVYRYTERNEQYGNGVFHHLDTFECLNPLPHFWSAWWHGDRPPKASLLARQLTAEVMKWADENVELL